MSKTVGPLMSLSASKSVKKLLTFQERKSGGVAYRHTKPGDINPFTPSVSQNVQRAVIAGLVAQWKLLTEDMKQLWENAAKNIDYIGTGYHYFIHKGGVLPVIRSWSDKEVEWSDSNFNWFGYSL